MGIKIGASDVAKAYIGSSPVKKIYQGVNEIWSSETSSSPLYKLDVSGYTGGSAIPSTGTSSDSFNVGTTRNSGYTQIGYVNDNLFISDYAYIYHGISGLSEYTAKAKIQIYNMASNAPSTYARIMNDHSNNMEVFVNMNDDETYIIFGGGTTSDLSATGAYNGSVSGNAIICSGLNASFYTSVHELAFGVKNGTIYFYVDDVLVGSQRLGNPRSSIGLGEFDDWTGAHTAGMYIDSFEIYNEFCYTIPA